eukprot:1157161-Pelagomonas_calceolata.AAC.17
MPEIPFAISTGFDSSPHKDTHHSQTGPTHYLINQTGTFQLHVHKRHELGFSDTSGYCVLQ